MTYSPATWACLSGLCMVVPLPFLDDYLATRALRRALAIDAPTDAPLTEAQLQVLTEDRSSMLVGCLRTAVVWPLKKLFKTVLWFLTIKDVIDRTAYAAQVIAFVRRARAEGWLTGREREVRDAMEVAFGRTRWSPVTRVVLRYERPDLGELPDPDWLGRVCQGLRRQMGGAPMEELFAERARSEIEAG